MTDPNVTIRGSRSSERRIGILCVNLDPVSLEGLEALVAQTPGAHVVDNVDRHVTPREVMRMLEEFQHRVCVINFDEGEESARISQRIHEGCDTSVSIFAASSDSHPDQIIAAMRSGCSEYLLKPFRSEQIVDALTHIEARHQGKLPGKKGRIVTLMGAKGGAGVTSLALHLALNLVRQQQKVLLVDQHPALGDLALCLGLGRHQYSFYELANNMDRLDADLLQGFLLQHSSGLHVLDSPEAIHAFSNTPTDAIEHTLAFLAENYQFVIVDCPPGLSEDTCAVIRQSDRLAIVITPELPAIHNAIRSIQYLTGLHYPDENIDIVLNRYSRKSPLSEREIEASLHRQIAVKIPNDYDLVVNAINAGTPIDLTRKSELSAAFDAWTDRFMANEPVTEKAGKGSRKLFSLFGSQS
ncbi:MAG: AAA family ATPase [Candidatus Korobacteraceae bacterium]